MSHHYLYLVAMYVADVRPHPYLLFILLTAFYLFISSISKFYTKFFFWMQNVEYGGPAHIPPFASEYMGAVLHVYY
jgi:hypothetical protein